SSRTWRFILPSGPRTSSGCGQLVGEAFLLLETGQGEVAHPLDVLGPEGRMKRHVREDLQTLRERFTEGVHADGHGLRACGGPEIDSEVLQLLGDARPCPGLRAL